MAIGFAVIGTGNVSKWNIEAINSNKDVKLIAIMSHDKNRAEEFAKKYNVKLDLLKLFLQIAWEIKGIDTKKYIILSEKLAEIGKMLGGWHKQVKQDPADNAGSK